MINKHTESVLFNIGNETLQQQEEYNYLGQMINADMELSADPEHDKEILHRIGLGWGALGKQSQLIESMLPLSLKIKVLNECIQPVATCGEEAWYLTKELESKLRSAQRANNYRRRAQEQETSNLD